MSIFSKLFPKKKQDTQQITGKNQQLTLNEIPFDKISDETFNEYWQKRMDGKITDEEYDKVRRMCMPHCKMSVLADNEISLYRMAKSSPEIAQKSIEKRRFIQHKVNEVTAGNSNGHGLSLTTANNLLSCVAYGDTVIKVKFDKDKLQEKGMLDELVYRNNAALDEYSVMKFITTEMYSLANPATLKYIIDLTNDVTFEKCLITPSTEDYSVGYALKNFELINTLTYWEKIQDRYHELSQMNVENRIGILRIELGELLKNTPIVGNDVFNGAETVNLTTSIDEKDKEI